MSKITKFLFFFLILAIVWGCNKVSQRHSRNAADTWGEAPKKTKLTKPSPEPALREMKTVDRSRSKIASKKYETTGSTRRSVKEETIALESVEMKKVESLSYDEMPEDIEYEAEEAFGEADFEEEYIDDFDGEPLDQDIRAGLLTAGEVNDFSKWELWQDIDSTDLKGYREHWRFNPKERYVVQLTNEFGGAVIDAKVELKNSNGKTLWSARTDNTGKAELWAQMFDLNEEPASAVVTSSDGTHEIKTIKPFHEGINTLTLASPCETHDAVDIAFAVDATGSMGDEIRYLKTELGDVITRAKEKHKDLTLRLGTVFYRDQTDAYLTRTEPFSENHQTIVDFIHNQTHGGGGDFPEAVDAALDDAMNTLRWSPQARARLLFLVLDAPPHSDSATITRMQQLTSQAAEKGIRIIPITASGIDKSTEYLMRSLALATNGTYVFLTDDSGIGNPHIKPTTDDFKVELLNDLILRLISQYTQAPPCDEQEKRLQSSDSLQTIVRDTLVLHTPIDTTQLVGAPDSLDPSQPGDSVVVGAEPRSCDQPELVVFPNPTFGQVTMTTNCPEGEVFIADMNGKLLFRFSFDEQGSTRCQFDLNALPSATYIVQYLVREKKLTEKILKVN